ncbi:hypothetical protein ACH4YN_29105 [Streptomyces griseofuscus]|uniref:hypothetical protein n=1 Tax=Streptomyces griseofuscus TaxID=146922 RepID=UPI0037A1FE6B
MLTMMVKRAEIEAHDETALQRLSERLPETYQAIVGPLIDRQAQLLNVPKESLVANVPRGLFRRILSPNESVLSADVYVHGSTLIALRVTKASRLQRTRSDGGDILHREMEQHMLHVTFAAPDINNVNLAEFEDAVKEVWGVSIKEVKQPLRRLREIAPNGKAEKPTDADIACAETLSDKSCRSLAIAIKSSGGLLLSDTPKQIPSKDRGRVDEVVQALEKIGVVETEIVVVCSKNATQVNRVPNVEVLKTLDEHGVRCSCGKPLSAEIAEEALSVTEYGQSMLDGSRWFSVLVLQHLLDLGIPLENIRMEQEYSGEEVDCMADVYGRLILFELKDKQFNLGNAYSFGAKVGIFRPDYPVIVTTERVGSDAREHFVRSANSERNRDRYSIADRPASDMVFIEGIPSLRKGLESLITSIAIEAFSPHLDLSLSYGSVSPESILSVWASSGAAQ